MSAITIETRLSDVVDYPTREQHGRFYVNDFRRSLTQLDEFLSRPATIGDLTVTTIDCFKSYLVGRGYKPSNVTKNITFIRRIWKQLHSRLPDVVSPQVTMRQKQPPRVPREPIPLKSISPKTSIRAAFDSLELDPKYRGRSYVSKCRWSIAQFDRMLGRLSTLSDLNPATVDRFAAFLGATFKASTTRSRATILRRVWRWVWSKYPEHVATPPLPDCRPHSTGRRAKSVLFAEPTDEVERSRDLELFFRKFYIPRRLVGRSQCTIQRHLSTIRSFSRYLSRRPRLDDLTDECVGLFLQARLGEGKSPHSVAGDRFSLNAFANLAARKRIIPEFLDVPPVPVPHDSPEAWSMSDLQKLLDVCRQQTGTIAGLPAADWWTAMHLFLLDCGERASATLRLRWEWIDRDTGDFTVPARARKGKVKPLSGRLMLSREAINSLWRPGREYVFFEPGQLSIDMFYYRYRKLLRRGGLPHGPKFKLQKLRRTFASLVESAGGDACAALLHSSRRITEQSYIDPRLQKRRPASSFVVQVLGAQFAETSVVADDDADEITDSLPLATLIR